MCPICVASALSLDFFSDGDDEVMECGEVPGFQLGKILGEGAAGVVWQAQETEVPHREVALKVLKSGSADGDRVRDSFIK